MATFQADNPFYNNKNTFIKLPTHKALPELDDSFVNSHRFLQTLFSTSALPSRKYNVFKSKFQLKKVN